MSDEFYISGPDMQAGLEAGFSQLVDTAGEDVVEACAKLVSTGDIQALFVPAVKLAADSALAVVSMPHVEAQLSREVVDRQTTVGSIAKIMMKTTIQQGVLAAFYFNHPSLAALSVAEGDAKSLVNIEYMQSLVAAPFYDAAKVCGGALRVLSRRNTENARAAIVRSRGLLAISGIHKSHQERVHDFLGKPYVRTNLLKFNETEAGPKVSFTEHAVKRLARYQVNGRGCPAGRLNAEGGSITLLEQYWQKLVDFLVPEDATANAR